TGICLALEAVVFWLRMPALAGIPLLVLVIVPSIVRSELEGPFFFALAALMYLGVMLASSNRPFTRATAWLGGLAVFGALVVPVALPSVIPGDPAGSNGLVATGVNPIISLGDDLRQADDTVAISYTTNGGAGLYLRLSTLDDFGGTEWAPSNVGDNPGNSVIAFGPPPGLTPTIATTAVKSSVSVADIASRWLPLPYAPAKVTGLVGTWTWEPDGLATRSSDSNMRNQKYTVESTHIAPTADQLVAAGTAVEPGMERYLELPADLPKIVATTAAEVVGDAATNFEKAMALQAYFQGGDFTYSQDAPVADGYDGSGAKVLGAFLEKKAGYCVHFSSAMAAMARTLGIPARVAVGFTPGAAQANQTEGFATYTVTTHDFHAWPELYFVGVGWVQFEPTPGIGLSPAAFTTPAVDDPSTPDVDESKITPTPTVAPTTAPTGAPTSSGAPIDQEEDGAGATSAARTTTPWLLGLLVLVVALVLAPWAARVARRAARFAELRRGASVMPAWEELQATAKDLGWDVRDTDTPRDVADDIARMVGAPLPSLDRLRHYVELESFAGQPVTIEPADVLEITGAMRASATVRDRILATAFPRSVLPAWLDGVAPEAE
ncbi:MAG: DUF3488 and transglutaminase-like domain-containing protein, partial [Rhodoglobus sp.]